MKKLKAKIIVTRPVDVIGKALEDAIERGMKRHDKYSDKALSESSRSLLLKEIEDSFWLFLDEQGLEIR
jgi:hypothetical protein